MSTFYELQLESNFKRYINILQENLDSKKFDIVGNLITNIFKSDRVASCPCASNISYHGAYPGGMVEYCLKVYDIMLSLNNSRSDDKKIPSASIATVSLLGGLGYLGTVKEPLFLDETSLWHKKNKGDNYKFNQNLSYMSVNHRTLFILQGIGFKLSNDEFLSFMLSREEKPSSYNMREPVLAEDYFYACKVAAKEMQKEHESELKLIQESIQSK